MLVDSAGNVFVAGSTNSPPYGGDVITFAGLSGPAALAFGGGGISRCDDV